MKFFNKQTLAFAIVGALAAGNASAGAVINTANTVYAKEIAMPATLTVNLNWNLGYNFNDTELRYACVKLTGATPVAGTVTPSVDEYDSNNVAGSSPATDMTVGAVNVNGNVAFFTLTSGTLSGKPDPSTSNYKVNLNALQFNVPNQNTTVTATVGLYDNPAAAGTCDPASAQLIPGSGDTKQLISFKPSYKFSIDPNKATASVDNAPTSFAGFKYPVAGVSTNADEARLAYAELVQINVGNLKANGTPIALTDIFPATATLKVDGDFGAWLDYTQFDGVNGTVSGAGTSASWTVDPTALGADFYVYADSTSTEEIPAGIYSASLKVTPNSGYDLGNGNNTQVVLVPSVDESLNATDNQVDDNSAIAGQIVQDGVRLQAPLVQVPTGWISRMVITNTGNKDRTFFLTVQGEDGNTLTTGNLTGYTVKAKSTYVINDLNTVLQGFTGAPRATIVATVAGPEKEIKGLYQIVNTTSMSLSNYVMVNQDTGGH
ncbi:hypothetical protein [Thermomonas sp.]|uniref:hypothetical protein n=1 Tax=Thermomonas sp. TaxID=1971895 RepID=UPI00391DE860